MAHCLETVRNVIGIGERRNTVVSIGSGLLFFIGWWIIIDCAAIYPDQKQMHHAYHVCGVVGTIAFFMVNSISNERMQGDLYSDGCVGRSGARAWLFVGFVLSFVAVIAAVWILFEAYVTPGFSPSWPGIAVVLQNVLILASSMLFKFGRVDEF